MTTSFLYGPVPSRRLGRSLGIDVMPHKTCTYDCIYCQLGRTTVKTTERREYVPLEAVAQELERQRDMLARCDYITIAGSGEPTLYSKLGDLISLIKARTDTPVAIITNGSLLGDGQVQQELRDADLVVPSLDAGDAMLFEHVNRPAKGITFEAMVAGLVSFRGAFRRALWLEVLLVAGMTGIASEVRKIAAFVSAIRPDKVQVTTAVRPAVEQFACRVPLAQMRRLAALLGAQAEVVSDVDYGARKPGLSGAADDILTMLRRRPCTLEDIVAGLGLNRHEAIKHLDRLVQARTIDMQLRQGRTFFTAAAPQAERLPSREP
jgi:wyosine [tRNA(Phe)-imidazoG37] synthetase (radical SAM superfamily)